MANEVASRPRQAENLNDLRQTAFEMTIPKIKNTIYNVQQCNIPSISLTPVQVSYSVNPTWEPGEILQYDDFTASFIVDEDMRNYIDLLNWFVELGFPRDHKEFQDDRAQQTSDIVVSTFTNSFVPNLRIQYINAFPISLSEISFDTTVASIEPIIATVVFKYESFDIKTVKA